MLYSLQGKPHRLSIPQASLVVVIGELVLPLDVALTPVFFRAGEGIYAAINPSFTPDPLDYTDPFAAASRLSMGCALGGGVWALLTPLVIAQIRILSARFAPSTVTRFAKHPR
jgi:hypothetical protein